MEARTMPGDNGAKRPEVRDESPHRKHVFQRPKRQAEASARRQALKIARWISAHGGKLDEAARLVGVSPRTLRCWRRSRKDWRSGPRMRGRGVRRLDFQTRTRILELLKLLGPRVGMPTLRPLVPDVPRSALRDMLHRFRDVQLYFEDRRNYVLEWTRPGAVWAMDHKDRLTAPIDGRYPHALAQRDLGANHQIDWLPVDSKEAEETDRALEARYRELGPPLVQKADGGFTAKSTRELVKRWGVFLLLSPPHLPNYNGSIEAGICSMTARTDHHAARSGRPGEWSCEDLEAARLEANETARPRGCNGPTPDELWANRVPISQQERDSFKAAVEKSRSFWWRLVVGHKTREEVTQAEEDDIMRKSISSALVAQRYLLEWRRRSFSTTFPGKSGKD